MLVEIYEDEESIPMPMTVLKFLSRVYKCKLKYIANLSEEISENLSQASEESNILLV